MVLLRVDHLTTGYERAPVLRDLDLEVGDELVAVLGANGAGKTTLLRALAGQLRAWHGEITLDGIPLQRSTTWQRARQGLAHVPEGRHVFTAMTAAENLEVAGLIGTRASRRRDEVFDLFPRLAERADQRAGSMSGGEQQMLAIGRALMTEPRILLIDEMSAGLAPAIVRDLVERLAAIRAAGVGVLLVEQSPQFVLDVVDRICVIERGRITRQGTLDDIGGRDGLAGTYLGGRAPQPNATVW